MFRSLKVSLPLLGLLWFAFPVSAQIMIPQSTTFTLQVGPIINSATHIPGIAAMLTGGPTATATAGTTTSITLASSASFVVGQMLTGTAGTHNTVKTWVTAIPDGTHLTIAPATTGAVDNTDVFASSQVAVMVSKDGGTPVPPNGFFTDPAYGGLYNFAMTATDTATLKTYHIQIVAVGAATVDPYDHTDMVTAFNPYDGTRGGLLALPNAAAEAAGGLFTRGTGAGQVNQAANGQIDVNLVKWLSSTPDALSSGKIPADLKLWLASAPASLSTNGYVQGMLMRWLTDNAGGTPNALATNRVDASVGAYPGNTPQTGDNFARLGAPVGASISADIAAIQSTATTNGTSLSTLTTRIPGTIQPQTGDAFARIGAAGAGLTAIGDTRIGFLTGDAFARIGAAGAGLTALGDTRLGFLTGDAYTRIGAPVGASISADIAAVQTTSTANGTSLGTLTTRIPGTVQPQTGDAFARIGAPAGASASADIAAVKSVLGTPAGASVSADVATANTSLSTLTTRIPGVVQPQTGDAFARLGAPVGASISADVAGVAASVWGVGARTLTAFAFNPTVGGYAGGQDPATLVLGATAATWNGAGTIGQKINAAGTAGDPLTAAVPGAYGAGTAGFVLGTYLTGNSFTRLGAPTGASITADIQTRSTYAGGDTAGTTTLLTRIPGTVQPQTGDAFARLGAPVGASISADVAGVAAAVWGVGSRTLTAFAFTPTIGGYSGGQDPATLVLNATASSFNTALSIGNKINSAASAGDPWTTALPGAYGAGTAGFIVGTNLNATVASRSTYAGTDSPGVGTLLTRLGVPTVSIAADVAAVPTAIGATPIDATGGTPLTLHQTQVLQTALLFDSVRTWNAGTHTATLTWYRRGANASTPDLTKPVMVKTTVYAADNVQVASQSVTVTTANLN